MLKVGFVLGILEYQGHSGEVNKKKNRATEVRVPMVCFQNSKKSCGGVRDPIVKNNVLETHLRTVKNLGRRS